MAKRRTYTAVERQRAVDAGRERIVVAARDLLEDDEGKASRSTPWRAERGWLA